MALIWNITWSLSGRLLGYLLLAKHIKWCGLSKGRRIKITADILCISSVRIQEDRQVKDRQVLIKSHLLYQCMKHSYSSIDALIIHRLLFLKLKHFEEKYTIYLFTWIKNSPFLESWLVNIIHRETSFLKKSECQIVCTVYSLKKKKTGDKKWYFFQLLVYFCTQGHISLKGAKRTFFHWENLSVKNSWRQQEQQTRHQWLD